jgi:BirA family transcriptional regulator, biotin operon repressor / biotin---[acetyl-CoA-carboxylase] ligase
LDIERIKRRLSEVISNVSVVYYDVLDSTNEYAKTNESISDTLIICGHQTKGRGRFNRIWQAEEESDITFTIVKDFQITMDEIVLVNFYTTYILQRAIKQFMGDSSGVVLKWPNDILVNSKKVSGILIEVKNLNKPDKKFIIGVGLNVNQEKMPSEIEQKATSLLIEYGKKIYREDLLCRIVKSFYENIDLVKNRERLLSLWKENFGFLNMQVNIRKFIDDEEIPVIIRDIGLDGGLIVEHNDGSKSTYYSGEISLSYN